MSLQTWVVNNGIKGIIRVLCRVDDAALTYVPTSGPLILVVNHINFLDVPLLYTHLHPRRMTALAKAETWNNPALAFLSNLWGAIPIRRGEADVQALQRGISALQNNYILVIAPEGTRSGSGCLQRGKPGVALLAAHSGAPILPLAYYGGESFKHNIRRLRRTDFHIAVGAPFHVQVGDKRLNQESRQQIADEIMYQLAALLPPAYRGYYADLDKATEAYLHFPDTATSSLQRARMA